MAWCASSQNRLHGNLLSKVLRSHGAAQKHHQGLLLPASCYRATANFHRLDFGLGLGGYFPLT